MKKENKYRIYVEGNFVVTGINEKEVKKIHTFESPYDFLKVKKIKKIK